MASVRKRLTASGDTRYDVRYRTPTGSVRTKTFRRRKEADRFLTSVSADLLTGRWVDPRRSRQTLGDWWAEWWPSVVDLRASTRARDESYWRNHVEPAFGATPMACIDHQAIAAWVAELSGSGLAPATVHKAHQVLSKPLRAAVRAGRLVANQADGVPLPSVTREEMRFLSPAEVATLADAIDPRYRAFVVLGAYGGLRLGELLALRWNRVDLLRRRLEVTETTVEVRGRLTFGPPKTRAGRRRVPLPRVAVDALEAHQAAHGATPDRFVFPAPDGGPGRAGLFRRRFWYPAAIAAGLGRLTPDPASGRKRYDGLRIHDLRHTAVSLWIAAGASPKEIATRAGHTSVSVVLDRYGHLLPGSEDAVNDALDALADSVTVAPILNLERKMGSS
jgi:integrase